MSTTDDTSATRRGSGSNDLLGQATEARWYCLDRDGVAMLCKDEADAREQVIESSDCWPNRAPYRAALLGDVAALAAENAALKREAHTWSKAAEHYAKPVQPLDPLDVEELWDVANADPYVDEVHQAFARLVERKHGIGG